MANALYDLGREGFLRAEIDADTAVFKVALVRGYTPNLATHKFVSDVTGAGGTLVATSAALASGTFAAGTLDFADITWTAVAAGAACQQILLFQSSAVTGGADVAATAQRVVALYDTGTGLPVTPNGGDITVQWNASGLFKL